MKKKIYKVTFITIAYLLFSICFFISNIDSWIVTVVLLGVYSMGLHYCYGYIFDLNIELDNGTLKIKENPYGRLLVFICGAFIVLSTLTSMSGYIQIWDFEKMEYKLESKLQKLLG